MSTPRRQRVYEPRRLMGKSVEELRREMQEELDNMSLTMQELTDFDYLPQAALPERYSEGSIRFLEAGASPDGMAGLHQVRDGAWRRLWEEGQVADADPAWIEPTLLMGNNDAGSFARVAYRKLESGMVVLKGFLRNPTTTTVAFVLPVGYRPLETHVFTVETNAGTTGRMDVRGNGEVFYHSGGTNWTTLSGILFYAEG